MSSVTDHFNRLKERGLKEVWLAVSDAQKGLTLTIQKSFTGCSWQRCKVHLMRNKAIDVLEEGLEDSLQYYSFTGIDHRKISSTNVLERLNKEIRRRTKVVGIFPSLDSYIRLVSCYMIEYAEDWESGRTYINKNIIQDILEHRKRAA